jgi:hypothetical protein
LGSTRCLAEQWASGARPMAVVGGPDGRREMEKRNSGSAPRVARQESARAQQIAEAESGEYSLGLSEPGLDYWSSADRTDDERTTYVQGHIYPAYQIILQEFYESADVCVSEFKRCQDKHRIWRYLIIIVTGVVAILNALTALLSQQPDTKYITGAAIVGAVAAAGLALLANLENFGNYLERAHAYRESRELFLDSAREFERLWETNVVSFWPSSPRAEACINAGILYRMICNRDRELRRKVKEMTKPGTENGAA